MVHYISRKSQNDEKKKKRYRKENSYTTHYSIKENYSIFRSKDDWFIEYVNE